LNTPTALACDFWCPPKRGRISPNITILVGVFKGDARLRIVSGANDGDNSAIVGKVGTGVKASAVGEHAVTEPPSLGGALHGRL
jgi:hypothetical protein